MVTIIECPSDDSVDWYVSFDGYNPSDEDCVRCKNEKEAIKLRSLINNHIRVWYSKERKK